jgi:hypothetical protein
VRPEAVPGIGPANRDRERHHVAQKIPQSQQQNRSFSTDPNSLAYRFMSAQPRQRPKYRAAAK